MTNGPVGVVGNGVDAANGHQRPLKGGHAIECHAGHQELDHRIVAQLVPSPAQGEQAVEHAAPGRRPQHQREEHAKVLQPHRQRGVEQVVRPRPNVDEHQRPEVNDREPVRIHRPVRRLGHEIVHDPQNRRRQKEGHRIVAIPPLHQAVLQTAENRVRMGERSGHRQVVDDVEHRHSDDGGHVEPQRYVQARLIALGHRPEKVDGKHHPDEHHRQIDRPDELGVFLAAGETGRQRERGRHNDELPTPEVNGRERVRGRAHLAQPLGGVVNPGKHHVADKGENHRVGVQRTQPPERQVGDPVGFEKRPPIPAELGRQPVMQGLGHHFQHVPVHLPPRELAANEHSEGHANDGPKDRGAHEAPD